MSVFSVPLSLSFTVTHGHSWTFKECIFVLLTTNRVSSSNLFHHNLRLLPAEANSKVYKDFSRSSETLDRRSGALSHEQENAQRQFWFKKKESIKMHQEISGWKTFPKAIVLSRKCYYPDMAFLRHPSLSGQIPWKSKLSKVTYLPGSCKRVGEAVTVPQS